MAAAVPQANRDTRQLARSAPTVRLLVEAVGEGFTSLEALVSVRRRGGWTCWSGSPPAHDARDLRWWFGNPRSERYTGRHAGAATDKLEAVASELRALAQTARVQTPTIDELFASIGQYAKTRAA